MTRVTGNNETEETETPSVYNQLQEQLAKLNYTETFTPESIPLIQKLLKDLLAATENCQILKSQYQKVEREKWETQCQVSFELRIFWGVSFCPKGIDLINIFNFRLNPFDDHLLLSRKKIINYMLI